MSKNNVKPSNSMITNYGHFLFYRKKKSIPEGDFGENDFQKI